MRQLKLVRVGDNGNGECLTAASLEGADETSTVVVCDVGAGASMFNATLRQIHSATLDCTDRIPTADSYHIDGSDTAVQLLPAVLEGATCVVCAVPAVRHVRPDPVTCPFSADRSSTVSASVSLVHSAATR